jgi:hypothetical protein
MDQGSCHPYRSGTRGLWWLIMLGAAAGGSGNQQVMVVPVHRSLPHEAGEDHKGYDGDELPYQNIAGVVDPKTDARKAHQ